MCTSTIASFINQVFPHDAPDGTRYNYICYQLAQWVSWQSYISPNYGALPVSLIIVQWGIESGWGGPNISQYYNPAEQGDTCGWPNCGVQPGGVFPRFCNIVDGVKSYSALMINGYPHVMYGWPTGGGGAAGARRCAVNLGQGYESSVALSQGFCGGPPTISSSSPRIWDAGGYNSGGGPGSSIYTTMEAPANADCLPNLHYIQNVDPGLGF